MQQDGRGGRGRAQALPVPGPDLHHLPAEGRLWLCGERRATGEAAAAAAVNSALCKQGRRSGFGKINGGTHSIIFALALCVPWAVEWGGLRRECLPFAASITALVRAWAGEGV